MHISALILNNTTEGKRLQELIDAIEQEENELDKRKLLRGS